MQDNFTQTRSPLIRVENKKVAIRAAIDETLQPHPSTTLLFFDKEIAIFLESQATSRLTINGIEADRQFSTYNDFYGYLSTVDDAVTDAVRAASGMNITPDSPVLIETVVKLREFGGIVINPSEDSNWRIYDKHTPILTIPDGWLDVTTDEQMARAQAWISAKDIVESIEAKPPFMKHLSKEYPETVVWSSRNSLDDNRDSYNKLLFYGPYVLPTIEEKKNRLEAYMKACQPEAQLQ